MQQENLEKIKKLIGDSPILSPGEKSEWVSLLDLMEHRQLLQLESLLIAGQNAQQKKPEAPAVAKPAVLPKLSHIMNLPRPVSPNQVVPGPGVQKEPPKPVSMFAGKLKALLAEKELPSGHVAAQSELPAKIKQTEPVKPVMPPQIPKPKIPAPAPLPENVINKPQTPPTPAFVKSPVNFATKPDSLEPKIIPGLNYQAVSSQVRAADLQTVKEHIASHPQLKPLAINPGPVAAGLKPSVLQKPQTVHPASDSLPAKEFSANVIPNLSLNRPEDLSKINARLLDVFNYDEMLKTVRIFINEQGYYAVLNYIEQSPAYKAYIKTGMEILTNASVFERLKGQDGYLTRKQFERLADLLRQMQAV